LQLIPTLDDVAGYDALVGAVAHEEYRGFTTQTLARLGSPVAIVADVKGMWRGVELPKGMRRWEL